MKPLMALPCKNKHSDMEQRDKGYHCKSCDHVLTDFRNSTTEEINHAIAQNPGKICGVFNRSQFDYKVSHIQVPAFKAIGFSLLGILGFLGPVLTSCENDPATEKKQNAFNLLQFPMHIRGTVKDDQTGAIIPHFKVEILQHGKVIKTGKTDTNGDFDIVIHKKDLNDEAFKLAFGGTHYKRDTIASNLHQFSGQKVKLTIKAESAITVVAAGEMQTMPEPGKAVCVDPTAVEGMLEYEPPTAGVPAPNVVEVTPTPEPAIVEPAVIKNDELYTGQVKTVGKIKLAEEPESSKKKKKRKNKE